MIERFKPNGRTEQCEMSEIRKGDWFRTMDSAGTGPWLEAAADAAWAPRPDGHQPTESVWQVKTLPDAVIPL